MISLCPFMLSDTWAQINCQGTLEGTLCSAYPALEPGNSLEPVIKVSQSCREALESSHCRGLQILPTPTATGSDLPGPAQSRTGPQAVIQHRRPDATPPSRPPNEQPLHGCFLEASSHQPSHCERSPAVPRGPAPPDLLPHCPCTGASPSIYDSYTVPGGKWRKQAPLRGLSFKPIVKADLGFSLTPSARLSRTYLVRNR